MKIDLDKIDKENFMVHEHDFHGHKIYLVQPIHIGCKWNKDNLIFRSSVWSANGDLISAGFPKFFNWGENIQLSPVPTDLKNVHLLEKIDGSCLIVSRYAGKMMFRTRGTVDAYKFENGNEIDEIFKYRCMQFIRDVMSAPNLHCSILFEWISAKRKIILDYGNKTADFILIGAIKHEDYTLFTQKELDEFAAKEGLKRPTVYSFSTVDEMLASVKAFKGKEGIVVYSKNDQVMHKTKGDAYLALHHLKSELSSESNILDVWLTFGKPTYQEFYDKVLNQFDFELVEHCKGSISKICDARKKVDMIIEGMKTFTEKIKSLPSRKEQAISIVQAYGDTNRASFVFNLLDGKQLTDDQYKKIMFQVM